MLSRLVFSGVMERYPTLKIISHHLGGGMIPFFWGRILETYAPEKQQGLIGRVLPKPLLDYFSLFYYDTAVGGMLPLSAVPMTYLERITSFLRPMPPMVRREGKVDFKPIPVQSRPWFF